MAATWLAANGPAQAEQRVALIVGNGAYSSARLANPVNDAEQMARVLRSVGFEVMKHTDADMTTMRQAFVEFARRLKRQDSVGVFYYAGHAVQVAGQNYLIPLGADIVSEAEIPVQAVNLSELLGAMKGAAARVKIAILDACRNNPFESTTRGASRGLAPVTAPAGTLIAYATAPGEVAMDGANGNSPFTAALAQIIPTPGLEVEEVFKRTRASVLAATGQQQTPWEHSSLVGQFIFKPKLTTAESSANSATRIADAADARRLDEIEAWDRIRLASDPAVFRRHQQAYPGGAYEELATYKIAQLERQQPGWSWWQTSSTGQSAARGESADLFERAVKLEAAGGDPQSLVEAARLYRLAADQGVVTAMFNLGRMFDRGLGVARNTKEAAIWYMRAAQADFPAAQAALGSYYEFGEGVDQSLAEALRLYQLSADKGDPHGEASLAYLFAQGKGVARDLPAARRLYLAAAEKGQTRAMFNLALMVMRGEGGAVDGPLAIKWLNAAVDKGHAGAMRELAYMHDEGRFVDRDPVRAAEYLVAALAALKIEAAGGQTQQARQAAEAMIRRDYWSFSTRRATQKRLISMGAYKGRATGFFDSSTRTALQQLATAD